MKKKLKRAFVLLSVLSLLFVSACAPGAKSEEVRNDSQKEAAEAGTPESRDTSKATDAPADGNSDKTPSEAYTPLLENYKALRDITHYLEEENDWSSVFRVNIDMIMLKEGWGNTLYSPLSMNCLLAMIANGANDDLKEQFSAYFGSDVENVNRFYKAYIGSLVQSDSISAEIANIFFLKEGNAFNEDFLAVIADAYKAEHEVAAFDENFIAWANAWCAEKTHGLITEMPNMYVQNMDAVALNALSFQAKWATAYSDANVRNTTFYLPLEGNTVTVTGLYSVESTYLENDQAVGFMKAYAPDKNGVSRYAFVGILPKATDGDRVQSSVDTYYPADADDPFNFDLSRIDLEALLQTATDKFDVDVMIPEFSMECSFDLLEAAKQAGLPGLTDNEAFSGIADTKLSLCQLLQKTRIEVTREGTKAAAVSEAGFTGAAMPTEKPKRSVILNRPFAFMIYDLQTQTVLFLGKVVNPQP